MAQLWGNSKLLTWHRGENITPAEHEEVNHRPSRGTPSTALQKLKLHVARKMNKQRTSGDPPTETVELALSTILCGHKPMCPQVHHFDHSHAVQTGGISTPTNFSTTVSTKKLRARLRVGSAFVLLLVTALEIHRDVAFLLESVW